MSRVVVIGATGHIGSYLVPRLVRGGHEVIAMSRGARDPYHPSPQWGSVTRVTADREAEDAGGDLRARIAALHPDVVIDLVCFTAASARQLVDALRPSRPLLVHCGTIWVHGPALRVPVTEDEPRTAYGEYGTGKAEIEALLHRETLAGGVPADRAAPRSHQRAGLAGHHAGRQPGSRRLDVPGDRPAARAARSRAGRPAPRARRRRGAGFRAGAVPAGRDRGQLPRGGRAGDDAARPGRRGRGWFGREPVLDFVDWAEFERRVGAEHAETTREHTFRSITASIARAREVLGYAPRYSSLDALHEALTWLVAHGQVDVGEQAGVGGRAL